MEISIEESLLEHSTQANKRNLSLTFDIIDGRLPAVRVDARRLNGLSNLLNMPLKTLTAARSGTESIGEKGSMFCFCLDNPRTVLPSCGLARATGRQFGEVGGERFCRFDFCF